jgi:vitamin B12 transporter
MGRLLAAALFVIVPGAIGAAEPLPQAGELQPDVVVTATRVPTPVEDIPAGVTVITREEIEQRGYNTLAEALSAVPGVRVAQSGGPGGNGSVFIRGTNSNHVLVLRDGMPINDSSDPGAAFNFGVDTLADVERIEIVRGPMASLYGSGAIGGVINLITRQGHEKGVHFVGELAGGYPAQVLNSEILSGIVGPLDYAAIVQTESLTGFDSTPQREAVFTDTPQGFREQIGTLNLGYTPVPGTRFSVVLRGRRSVFGFNQLGSPTFDTANSTGHDTTLYGRVGVHSLMAGGVYETGVYVGGLQNDRKYFEPFNPADIANLASNDSRFHGRESDIQWNNTIHLSDLFRSTVLSATNLTFGYERTGTSAQVRANSSTSGFVFQQSVSASMVDQALYAGLQSTAWDRLTVTGQIRQDWVLNNQPFTWRLGAVADVPELLTRFKAAYGTAFLAPSLFDRFGVDSTGFIGNPNLLPERAQGWEIGFTTTIPALGQKDAVSFTATYFNEQINNLIVTVFFPIETSQNIGSAHIQGVETELTLHPAHWLTVDAIYTYTQPENADTGEKLLRRPQNTASLDVTLTPTPRLTIVPELLYTGAFRDFLIDNNGFGSFTPGTSRQGVLFNLSATYDVTPQIQFFATGRNLAGSRFEPVNGFQTPGRNFFAGVRMRL